MPDGSEKYIEEIPGVGPQYNVGNIVKDLLDHYIRIQPNRATPHNIAALLADFKTIANDLKAQSFMVPFAPLMGVPMQAQWKADLDAFWERLQGYEAAVEKADPDDRAAILNSVTIPLFFGTEGPSGLLRGADIRTPFQLANGLMLNVAWREDSLGRVWEDIAKSVTPSLPAIKDIQAWPTWLKILGIVTGVYVVVKTAKAVGRR